MKLAVLVLLLLSVTACSSSPAPDGADGVAPLMTGGAAPRTGDATTDSADCGSVAATVEEHLRGTDIRSVTVVGQCTLVVIETALGDEDGATAREICESAAEVAYTGDTNAIAVKSRAGAELSQGISGLKCLP